MAKSVARRCPARWSWSQVTSQWWLLSWPIFDVKWMEVPWVCWGCYVFPISGGPAKRLIPSIPSILQCLQCFLISHMKQQLEMKNIVSGLDFGLIWAIWAILCVTWHQSSSSFIIKHYINQKPPRKFWGGVFFCGSQEVPGSSRQKTPPRYIFFGEIQGTTCWNDFSKASCDLSNFKSQWETRPFWIHFLLVGWLDHFGWLTWELSCVRELLLVPLELGVIFVGQHVWKMEVGGRWGFQGRNDASKVAVNQMEMDGNLLSWKPLSENDGSWERAPPKKKHRKQQPYTRLIKRVFPKKGVKKNNMKPTEILEMNYLVRPEYAGGAWILASLWIDGRILWSDIVLSNNLPGHRWGGKNHR